MQLFRSLKSKRTLYSADITLLAVIDGLVLAAAHRPRAETGR
jgi:hypothetical protein